MENIYDVTIIGGGPSGLTAGVYSSGSRMKCLLLERSALGGQLLTADMIENFPAFPNGIKGPKLANLLSNQVKNLGLEVRTAEAENIIAKKDEKEPFSVILDNGDAIKSLSLIIATGAAWKHLGVPGEEELAGRGVSYCATCDGPLFKEKRIVVAGGGDTALEDALYLTKFAKKITIVHRRDKLRAAKILQERATANGKIEFCLNSNILEVVGKKKVEGVKIKDAVTNKEKVIDADGVFILIGIMPNSEVVKGLLKVDDKGYIISDDEMRTSLDGAFVSGDVRKKFLRQIVTATAEGAIAAVSAQHYVERIKDSEYPPTPPRNTGYGGSAMNG